MAGHVKGKFMSLNSDYLVFHGHFNGTICDRNIGPWKHRTDHSDRIGLCMGTTTPHRPFLGRGKTIRSVLCNIVCNNCAQCDAHTYEQTNRSLDWVFLTGPISLCLDSFLWSPYVIGQTIIFLPCSFFLPSSSSFFSSPNLSSRRLDVYHTSAHGVVLV